MKEFFAFIDWSFPKFIWKSEQIGLQLSWYGVLFALGILIECWLGLKLAHIAYDHARKKYIDKEKFNQLIEKFALCSIPFIVVGARIAYVLFYGGRFYWKHPMEIFQIWHGGLASHGGIIGLLLWIVLFVKQYQSRVPYLTFLFLCDICCSVFGWGAFLIRIGNFINQEIVGKPTSLPWGVVFSDPVQGRGVGPVHPVQLYEGIAYLVVSVILYFFTFKRKLILGSGITTSIALISIAVIRFVAEFFKSHQGSVLSENSLLSMGQWLSLPLFAFGVVIGARVLLRKNIENNLL